MGTKKGQMRKTARRAYEPKKSMKGWSLFAWKNPYKSRAMNLSKLRIFSNLPKRGYKTKETKKGYWVRGK